MRPIEQSTRMSTEDLLSGWTKPSSSTEQEKQDRTERMIREATDAHSAFNGCQISVYAKGSYPNNTNVRTESDVDVAVQCSDVIYYDLEDPSMPRPGEPYVGPWTPGHLRSELTSALQSQFGDQVDATGNVAIKISSSTARVDADVVPCFDYREYFLSGGSRAGTRIFRKDGSHTNNYPQQHLEFGRTKNNRTNYNYKKAVRILKRAANAMESDQYHRRVASFLVESLVYNCPDSLFMRSTWTQTVRGLVAHIWESTQGEGEPANEENRWLEANQVKFLFHSAQKWSRRDARDFSYAVWNYLDLD